VVSLFNFISDPKLRRTAKTYSNLVSILIPARNEEKDILNLLNSIQQQDYIDYEVIILDDTSTDNTFKICQQFADKHRAFKVIKGETLPPGWSGKNYACWQLAQKAKGDFLLFLDADCVVTDGLINSAVHRMYLKDLALLSILPNQQMKSLGEQAVIPLIHYLLLSLLPLQLIYLIRSKHVVAASGQFMLFNAGKYQWHEQVRASIVEDAEIMRLIKHNNYNTELLLANYLLSSRRYKTYIDAINGLGKNLLAVFNYNIITLLIYLLILLGGPLIIITTLNINLIVFMLGLTLLERVMISLSCGQNVFKNIILHPIQLCNIMVIAFVAIQKHLTRKTKWKGRSI